MLCSPSALPQTSQETQDASGQQAFNNACRTCHVVKEGDNRLGPHLAKVLGRKAGSLPDYGYSSAMKEAGFAWDREKLERFIANPDEVVPGNRMKPYTGVASSDDRAKIVAFLGAIALTGADPSSRTSMRWTPKPPTMPLDAGLQDLVHRPAPPVVAKKSRSRNSRQNPAPRPRARTDLMSMTPSPIMPRSFRMSLVGTSQSQT